MRSHTKLLVAAHPHHPGMHSFHGAVRQVQHESGATAMSSLYSGAILPSLSVVTVDDPVFTMVNAAVFLLYYVYAQVLEGMGLSTCWSLV